MKFKQILATLTVLIFLFSGQLWAQAKSQIDDSLKNFDKMMSIIKVSSVIGEPIRSEDTIVIPFARVSFGLGAGGAKSGFGGGMGGKTIPAGLLIIKGENVKVTLFPVEEKKPSLLQEVFPVLLKMLPQILGDKSPFSAIIKPPQIKTPQEPGKPVGEKSLSEVKKLFNEKRYSEALEIINSLVANDPKNADYHAWKGNIMGNLAGQGNPLDMMKYGMGAMQEFEKALELDPSNVTAHFGRGMARLMAPEGFGGDVDGAIEDFEFACKKDPFPEAYYYLGIAYKRKGLNGKAKEALKKALALKPDYKEAAKALAKIK